MEKEFSQYEKFLKFIAWRATRRYGGDYDTWLSEAYYGFVEAMQKFDESKGSLSTCIFHWATGRIQKKFYSPERLLYLSDVPDCGSARSSHTYDLLSGDARYICEVIFIGDKKFIRTLNESVSDRSGVTAYLLEQGWDRKRITAAVKEIQGVLND